MFKENHLDVNSTIFIAMALKEVIENMEAGEEVFSRYFSPAYTQYVDGQILDYNDFVQHMTIQKTLLQSATLTIEHSMAEQNKICTVHKVNAIKKNGKAIEIQVVAYFELKEGKIALCKELTHLLSGSEEDRRIGSIK